MLPSLSPNRADIAESYAWEAGIRQLPQTRYPVVHTLHGGVYTRTVRVPAGHTVCGVLIQVPTTLIAQGEWRTLQGGEWAGFSGLQVLPGEAGRRQVVHTVTDCVFTSVMPTRAKTVPEAERLMSPEWRQLQSQDGGADTIINTHEDTPCQESAQARAC